MHREYRFSRGSVLPYHVSLFIHSVVKTTKLPKYINERSVSGDQSGLNHGHIRSPVDLR